jgi:hypothetical protein
MAKSDCHQHIFYEPVPPEADDPAEDFRRYNAEMELYDQVVGPDEFNVDDYVSRGSVKSVKIVKNGDFSGYECNLDDWIPDDPKMKKMIEEAEEAREEAFRKYFEPERADKIAAVRKYVGAARDEWRSMFLFNYAAIDKWVDSLPDPMVMDLHEEEWERKLDGNPWSEETSAEREHEEECRLRRVAMGGEDRQEEILTYQASRYNSRYCR